MNKHNWKGINYTSGKDDRKKSENNNPTIAINVWYAKNEKMYPNYVSKHNLKSKKQVVLLMIPNGKGWHYLAEKKLSALLRGTALKNNERKKKKIALHKKVCKNKDFCNAVMSSEDS